MGRTLKILGTTATFFFLFFVVAWLTVWWGTSGKSVAVPDLQGKNVVNALKEVGRIGLDLRVIREESDPTIPRDEIIDQYPKPGTRLKLDRNVQVVLSLGPRDIAIPDVRGSSLRKAELMLKQNGLDLGRVTRISSSGAAKEIVLSQNPMPLAVNLNENTIDLLVSDGPQLTEYRMPDLIGKDFQQTVQLLETAGLEIGKVKHEEYPGAEANQIINQFPFFGYHVSRDTPVTLVVHKEKTSQQAATVIRLPFSYRVPLRIPIPVATDIFLEDQKGRQRIFSGRKFPGTVISLTLDVAGEAVVDVYLNGKKAHTREYR